MAFINDFITTLRAIQSVSDDVGDRTYALVDTGKELPSIIFNTRGLAPDTYTKDSSGLTDTFIQLDIYADTYTQLNTLREDVIAEFNNYSGTMGADTIVSSCKVVNTREELDASNREVFRAIIEIRVLHSQSEEDL